MRVALLGDIGLFGKYTLENKNIFNYFREVSDYLKEIDVVVGNLETPFTLEDKPYGFKSAYIKSNPKNIELLKYLNISVVSIANNHLYDYGKNGYNSTIETLKKEGIEYFGIENKEYHLSYKRNKLAFSGFCCYSTNSLGYLEGKSKKGVNILDYQKVKNTLTTNDRKGYLNITSFHIGEEHIHYPNMDHIKLARKLSEKIPYIFYGHHPHVLQGIEKFNESLHLYSLGNFCFDDVYTKKSNEPLIKQKLPNKESCIVILDIQNNKLNNYEVVPIFDNGEKIVIDKSGIINEKIEKYNSYLKINESEFLEKRLEIRKKNINDRKNKRDFNWYLKRLNYRSFFLLKDLKDNSKKYRKYLKDKI